MQNKLYSEKLGRILASVRRPSTYLGNEQNSVHKNYENIEGSIALVFPDLYEIGMSHLGLKILYNIINSEEDLVAERAFAPAPDFAEAIKDERIPLMSLESKRPLKDFDIVGFTIPYELSYTTILWILDLAGIPLKASRRGEDDPFIVGGGAGVYNPEPIANFFDFFVLGDGEELTPMILRRVTALRGMGRTDVLKQMAKIPGVYVPSLFDVSYKNDKTIEKITPRLPGYEKAKRVFLPTLGESEFPTTMVVPFHATQNRMTVELDRGCTQACRFCQAGTTYRPARERTPDEVIDIIDKTIGETGYGEVSLASLSAGDYTKIEPLLKTLMDRYADERVSISMPSLRPATVTDSIVQEIGRVRKTGFTISSEAGNQRLRNTLNKKVTDDDIFKVAVSLLDNGWRSLKLYFMLGLPTESDADVESIFDLSERLSRINVNGKRFLNVTVSVSNFVPKAHTAFQWMGQDSVESLTRKKERLFELIRKNRKLKLKWHDANMSHMEAIFSRGDRRLSAVVEEAYTMGATLDAWTENFNWELWRKAFDNCGVDPAFHANRDFATDEILPWDHIDTGVTKKYLLKEYHLAQSGAVTEDCKTDNCLACGLNPKTCFEEYQWSAPTKKMVAVQPGGEQNKYRITYEKKGLSQYISHLELQSIINRVLRMVKAPLVYSQGHSPHPKIAYGGALGVGVESDEEFVDLTLYAKPDGEKLLAGINKGMPEGIWFKSISPLPPKTKSISEMVIGAEYEITLDEKITFADAMRAVDLFNRIDTHMVERTGKKKKVFDIKPMIENLSVTEHPVLTRFAIVAQNGASAKPVEACRAIFPDMEIGPKRIVKISNIIKK